MAVETLSTESIVVETQARVDQLLVATKIEGVVIVRLSQIILLKLSVSVTSIYMNTRVGRHESHRFI